MRKLLLIALIIQQITIYRAERRMLKLERAAAALTESYHDLTFDQPPPPRLDRDFARWSVEFPQWQ